MTDEVTQADRDAAAQLNGYANWYVYEIAPCHDAGWMELSAKDFARHAAPLRAEIARLREALETFNAAFMLQGADRALMISRARVKARAALAQETGDE